MHHYFEAITNTSGDSLVGYFGRVINRANNNTVTLASDDNGTPIIVVSGVENMAKTDDFGNLDFYVEPGTYDLEIYAPNATSLIMRVPNVAMSSSKGDRGDPGPEGPQGEGLADVMAPGGSALIGYRQPTNGSMTRTAASRMNDLGLTSGDQSGIVADGTTDCAAALEALFARGNARVLAGTYRLNRTVNMTSNRTIQIDPGTRFLYTGPTPAGAYVFNCNGKSNIAMAVTGTGSARWYVECVNDQPYVWAVGGETVNGLRVDGLETSSVLHTSIGGTVAYSEKVTPAMKAAGDARDVNTSSNITVTNGATNMKATANFQYSGAVFLGYVFGGHVDNMEFHRVGQGVQWWGGNGDHTVDGSLANERKCGGINISNIRTYDASGVGVWGSMGKTIRVRDSQSERCLDIGFDAEGCDDVRFDRCTAIDNYNGQFNTYFLNRNIVFDGCVAISNYKERPLISIYNQSQIQDNRDITWAGGRLEGRDPTGPVPITTNLGTCRTFSIINATIIDARIDNQAANQGAVFLKGNTFSLTRSFSGRFDWVVIRMVQDGHGQVTGLLSGNAFLPCPPQPTGTNALRLIGADPNLPAYYEVKNNSLLGLATQSGFMPILLETVAGSQPSRFVVTGNVTDGPINKKDAAGNGNFVIPAGSNINQIGQDAPVQAV